MLFQCVRVSPSEESATNDAGSGASDASRSGDGSHPITDPPSTGDTDGGTAPTDGSASEDAGSEPSGDEDAGHAPPDAAVREPVTLEPSDDCTQPDPEAHCENGFCRIEAGCFVMGSPRSEWAVAKLADRQVQVRLTHDFELGRTELTRAQWQAEGLDLPAQHRLAGEGDCTEPECPVTNVSFFDAVTFANRYSEQRDLEPCYRLSECSGTLGKDLVCQGVEATAESVYACEGYRLPTEAEWEYATRAGTRTAFFTGPITVLEHPSVCAPEPSLEAVAWYCYNSDGRPHPAGQKAANPWGLHDLAGNVFEWCNDIYSPAGYGDGPVTDPTGTLTPTPDLNPARNDEYQHSRVLRGGNHVVWAAMAKSGKRFNATQTIADTGLGLRLARTLPSGQKVSP